MARPNHLMVSEIVLNPSLVASFLIFRSHKGLTFFLKLDHFRAFQIKKKREVLGLTIFRFLKLKYVCKASLTFNKLAEGVHRTKR